MKHRLYQCTASEVKEARDKVIKKDRNFAERAADQDNKLLFEQGLVSVPRNWPKRTEELKAKWLEMIDDKLTDISDQVASEQKSFTMEGHLASDGSRSGGEWVTSLARAGWAAVQAEPGTGRTLKALYGAVWHPYPQSSQAGEWVGAAVAVQSAPAKAAAPWTWIANQFSEG